jgi:hypothetical protein
LLQQGGVPSRLIRNNLIAAYKEVAMKQHFNSTAGKFAALNVASNQRQRLSACHQPQDRQDSLVQ